MLDVKKLLAKMLQPSSCTNVALPFTPTANGLMICMIRNSATARCYQGYTNTLPSLVDNYTVADGYWAQVVFVTKGQQVALSTQSNVKSASHYFIPLGLGGVLHKPYYANHRKAVVAW